MIKNRFAATLLVTGTLVGGVTATSQAADSTTCDGTLSNRRISGDLVVPAGKTCTIERGSVRGDITLAEDSTLNLTGTTVHGNIGFQDADSSPWSRAQYTMNLRGARVQGSTTMAPLTYYTITDSRLGAVKQGFAVHTAPTGTIEGSTLDSINYAGGLKLNNSTVRGDFDSRYGLRLDLNGSRLNGTTSVLISGDVTSCGSTFSKDASFDAAYQVFLGGASGCEGNRFRGNLDIKARMTIEAYNNVVTGHTTSPSGEGMMPTKGSGNRFRGGVEGVLATLS